MKRYLLPFCFLSACSFPQVRPQRPVGSIEQQLRLPYAVRQRIREHHRMEARRYERLGHEAQRRAARYYRLADQAGAEYARGNRDGIHRQATFLTLGVTAADEATEYYRKASAELDLSHRLR